MHNRSSAIRVIALAALAATLVLAGCRPAIADLETSAPGDTMEPSITPPPAAALQPDTQVDVQIHTFRGLGPADAAFLYAQALDSYRQVNLTADVSPPIVGYDPFAVAAAPDSLTLWVGSIGDVAPSVAAGLDLVAIGEVTGRDPTVLAAPGTKYPKSLKALVGKTVLADTNAAADSLKAALEAAGVDPAKVHVQKPDDPTAPFDPSPLLDGTAAAAAVSVYDGWARIQEGLVAAGEAPESWVERPLQAAGAEFLGELVWVQKGDLQDPTLKAAATALLGVLASAQRACADAVEDCAGALAAQSDRTPEGLAWSIDQLDRAIFPAPDGIVHIDPAAWQRTIAGLASAGIAGANQLKFSDDLVDAVFAKIGAQLDLKGADWKPRDDLVLLP